MKKKDIEDIKKILSTYSRASLWRYMQKEHSLKLCYTAFQKHCNSISKEKDLNKSEHRSAKAILKIDPKKISEFWEKEA